MLEALDMESLSRMRIMKNVTLQVLDELAESDAMYDKAFVEFAIISRCNKAMSESGKKFKQIDALQSLHVALILLRYHHVVRIASDDCNNSEEGAVIAAYCDEGEDKGIYYTSLYKLHALCIDYSPGLTSKEFNEVVEYLQSTAPTVKPCENPDLVAVNNGIFNYRTKELMDFSPEYIFMSKSRVNYNPDAKNVYIRNEEDNTLWDVESWMKELSDDPEIVNLLWEILGAIIRPLSPWNKSAWFYSEKGNNGKGTLCELMRQLCGKNTYTSISLSDMSKDFRLESLVGASAIITDENDVGTYIDKAANLKAIVTGDVIQINRKFKSAITYRFRGLMVQCINEMPRIKDKSDSFFRRQIFVPFDKCFTGRERTYIKRDYLHRQDVLEYVLHRVLHMDYDKFTVPKSCQHALDSYKSYVDPIRSFLLEIIPKAKWRLLPWNFLYDLYQAWYADNYGDKNKMSKVAFTKDVKLLVSELFPYWTYTQSGSIRPADRMDDYEPMILEYNLTKWMNPAYLGPSKNERACRPATLATCYKGLYCVDVDAHHNFLLANSMIEEEEIIEENNVKNNEKIAEKEDAILKTFLTDIFIKTKWTLLPWDFLYSLYKAWYSDKYANKVIPYGKTKFSKVVKTMLIEDFAYWKPTGRSGVRPAHRMSAEEPLIKQFKLTDWENKVDLAKAYRGIYLVEDTVKSVKKEIVIEEAITENTIVQDVVVDECGEKDNDGVNDGCVNDE